MYDYVHVRIKNRVNYSL